MNDELDLYKRAISRIQGTVETLENDVKVYTKKIEFLQTEKPNMEILTEWLKGRKEAFNQVVSFLKEDIKILEGGKNED